MSRPRGKTQPTDRGDALLRLRDAREFYRVGESVPESSPKVAISLFVQSGIAASDSLCGMALGEYWRGDGHHGATALLAQTGDTGRSLAKALSTLLSLKDRAQYSSQAISRSEVVRAQRASPALLDRAELEAVR